jgi:hypothetical protein
VVTVALDQTLLQEMVEQVQQSLVLRMVAEVEAAAEQTLVLVDLVEEEMVVQTLLMLVFLLVQPTQAVVEVVAEHGLVTTLQHAVTVAQELQ